MSGVSGGRRVILRAWTTATAAYLAMVGSSHADEVARAYQIAAQPISSALKAFAAQSDMQLIYTEADVGETLASAVQGTLAPRDALAAILKGTDLQFEFTANNVIVVRKTGPPPSSSSRATDTTGSEGRQDETTKPVQINGIPEKQSSGAASRQSGDDRLEEVLVTAGKRGSQAIDDVPMSITAVTAADIQRRGWTGMSDYLATLPSVSFIDVGYTANTLVIRGLATNPAGSTRTSLVGMYIGETTVSGLVGLSAESNPDLRLVDMERIELLPGPQGTLYGDASMGGALRILPARPRTEAFDATLAGTFGYTSNAGRANSRSSAVLNVPVVRDRLALRIAGYHHVDQGVIRNVAGESTTELAAAAKWGGETPVGRVDDREYDGGKIALRWEPTPALNLTLTHLRQQYEQSGSSVVELGLASRFKQANFGGEFSSNDFRLTSLDMAYELDRASFVSSVAWVDSRSAAASDLERSLAEMFGGPVPVFQIYSFHNKAFTAEARLTSRSAGRTQWLAGAFHQYKRLGGGGGSEDWSFNVDWKGDAAKDPFDGAELLLFTQTGRTQQTALFGELSYDLMENLTATAGMRYYRYEKHDHTVASGVFAGSGSDARISNDDDGTTRRLNLAFRPNAQALLFATYSEGFRLGGPHTILPTTCDVDRDGLLDDLGIPLPTQVGSDETRNLELGAKLAPLQRRLKLNASIFDVAWTNIPVDVALSCGFPATINAGRARSRGIELSGEWRLAHLRANYAASYVNATLKRDLPPAGRDGDRLPGSPRMNGSVGLQYDFLMARRPAFVRADIGYVGRYFADLAQSAPRLGDYTTVGFRTGVALGRLDVDLFAQNLTNEYAVLWADNRRRSANVLRPRTVGIELRYDFNR